MANATILTKSKTNPTARVMLSFISITPLSTPSAAFPPFRRLFEELRSKIIDDAGKCLSIWSFEDKMMHNFQYAYLVKLRNLPKSEVL